MKRIVMTAAALSLLALPALAATSHSSAPAGQETKALNLLEAKGYGGFSNFHPEGSGYVATVTRSGHAMTVHVDPMSGRVTTAG